LYELGGHKNDMERHPGFSTTRRRIATFDPDYENIQSHQLPEKISWAESKKPSPIHVLNFSSANYF